MRETITDAELEVLRLKARGRYRIMLLCTGLAALLILYGVWSLMMEEDDSLFVKIGATLFGTVTLSCGALAFFYWLLFQKPYKAFNDVFKSRYVLSTITEMGLFGQLSYDPKAGFTHDDIRNAAVVACGDKRYFESEDLLTGCYQNVRFAFSDVTTKRMVRRGKRNELDTLFDGQVIRFDRFDHQKISNGHLQIFQKEFLSDLRGWTAEYKVETDSAAFNSKFQIYAADEHNAFYIQSDQTPHPPPDGEDPEISGAGGGADRGNIPGGGHVRSHQPYPQHLRRCGGCAGGRTEGPDPQRHGAAEKRRGRVPQRHAPRRTAPVPDRPGENRADMVISEGTQRAG